MVCVEQLSQVATSFTAPGAQKNSWPRPVPWTSLLDVSDQLAHTAMQFARPVCNRNNRLERFKFLRPYVPSRLAEPAPANDHYYWPARGPLRLRCAVARGLGPVRGA
jgi:hypothetical protein